MVGCSLRWCLRRLYQFLEKQGQKCLLRSYPYLEKHPLIFQIRSCLSTEKQGQKSRRRSRR